MPEQAPVDSKQDSSKVAPPTISLPKGGGAIRGMGEKFAANPVTGTGSMSVPIATSPGRSGFGPQLSLSYDSGSGNGPFGFGWSLSIPQVTRKTDKGLPLYRDAEESDVFILSGAEDLVPVLVKDAEGKWSQEDLPLRQVNQVDYRIQRYRPRIEGLFARIERWTDISTGESHWRSITKDNVTTLYGKDNNSRIFDQADPDPQHPTRIFSWLICQSYDDRGNTIVYNYKAEDSSEIVLSQAHEQNRTDTTRQVQRYLKHIRYGNRTPFFPNYAPDQPATPLPADSDWMFEVVFDYREHNADHPKPDDVGKWPCRQDPFSAYRAGFEVRTYRLCRRVLMFHHFPNELKTPDYLVRSTEFAYNESAIASFIVSVTQSGYVVPDPAQPDRYLKRSLPPVEFEYSRVPNPDELAQLPVREVDAESLENLPIGLDGASYQWMDLDGEGTYGILTDQANGWFYKRNLSANHQVIENGQERTLARFGPMEVVASKPVGGLANGAQFLDLAGDGQIDLVQMEGPVRGFYERTAEADWNPFRPFESWPNLDTRDPNLKFVDLTGDGHADILITEDDVFTWYPSLAEAGFGPAEQTHQLFDEEKGPRLVFADGTQSIYLADLSGDGLTDLARIRNGEVCYWPNLGYGQFGAKVTMDDAPWFDAPDQFDQRRVRLADTDGSGTTDILYLGRESVRLYFNQSGNRWAGVQTLPFPRVDNVAAVQVVDLLGNGTACLVWSSPLSGDARSPMRYVDLMGGQKPHLMIGAKNNLGATTKIQYAPSTKFYLADKYAGKPWITRIPFPVHVVEKAIVEEAWRGTTFSTQYTYHHGYFDGTEREFRGFGRVEQVDVESYGKFDAGNVASPYITPDHALYQPPIKTVTWFHTGAFLDRERILNQFAEEYFPNWIVEAGLAIDPSYVFSERALPEPDLVNQDLSADEWREALRACKGMTLRQEVYELDVDRLEDEQHVPVKLFTSAYHNCRIERLQPQANNRHAAFLVTESEALTYHYELELRNKVLKPDPRIGHSLVLDTNEYGQPLQTVAAGYPRVHPFQDTDSSLPAGTEALIRQVQGERHLGYTETRYTKDDIQFDDDYRLPVPCEIITYELTGIAPKSGFYFTLEELRSHHLSAVDSIPYHQLPDSKKSQKRPVEHARTVFFDENLAAPLAFGTQSRFGLVYETYKLALTNELLDDILRTQLNGERVGVETYTAAVERILRSAGYYWWDNGWWVRSGIAGFNADAKQHFFLPERYTDPFGAVTMMEFDSRDLFIQRSEDPVHNVTSVQQFDFRVLAPAVMKDANDNMSAVTFDVLGMPVGSAVMGKNSTESGDTLNGFTADLDPAEVMAFFNTNFDETKASTWLETATVRFVYSFGEKRGADGSLTYGQHPACACGILREKHVAQLTGSPTPVRVTPVRVAFEYSDGLGQTLVTKAQAEPEIARGALRWLASGKTIFNNKGKPVKQYEPYFSTNEHRFEELHEVGVTPLMYYDAAGRLMRTEMPNGAYSRAEFSPWFTASFDPNDTVLEADNAWYARNTAAAAPAEARRTAELSAVHADTPAVIHFDSLGRTVISVAHNAYRDGSGTKIQEKHVTFIKLDAEGKPLWIRDARGNLVMQYITPPVPDGQAADPVNGYVPCYDVAGNLLFQHSMDAGNRWVLNDATGQAFYAWDNLGNILRTSYDALRRPTIVELRNGVHPSWIVVAFTRYGEGATDDKGHNLRGKPYRSYDQSGLVTTVSFDFKGNGLEVQRRLADDFDRDTDWRVAISLAPDQMPNAQLMAETYILLNEYDALNRITLQYAWHQGVGQRVAVIEPDYNRRGLLQKEFLTLEVTKTTTGHTPGTRTPVVKALTYDAKGQRLSITYGNDVTTTYGYDSQTFRLLHLNTQRTSDHKQLQELRYTYDPSGNITEIADDAQPTKWFNNFQINARNRYTYDALYRLIEAEGREHAGQVVSDVHDNWHDCAFRQRYHPNDAMTWRNYTEQYIYDAVGNVLSVRHTAHGDTTNSWTRQYEYARNSNRLLATGIGNAPIHHYVDTPTLLYRYTYNTHGSMTSMPHLTVMDWNFTEHLQHVRRTAGTQSPGADACPDTSLEAWYRYDAAKQRTRKRVVKQGGIVEERIYLDGFEIYRKHSGGDLLGRETLHVMDDKQRIALVEIRTRDTAGTDRSPRRQIRYQFGNHLGSAALELDEQAQVVTYEEYHPYGTVAYQAVRSETEVPKRYRYTGKERDEESGFYYHGARHYASWILSWISCDPDGIRDSMHLYQYCKRNPVRLVDPNGTETWEQVEKTNAGVEAWKADNQAKADRMARLASAHKAALDSGDQPAANALWKLIGQEFGSNSADEQIKGLKIFGTILVAELAGVLGWEAGAAAGLAYELGTIGTTFVASFLSGTSSIVAEQFAREAFGFQPMEPQEVGTRLGVSLLGPFALQTGGAFFRYFLGKMSGRLLSEAESVIGTAQSPRTQTRPDQGAPRTYTTEEAMQIVKEQGVDPSNMTIHVDNEGKFIPEDADAAYGQGLKPRRIVDSVTAGELFDVEDTAKVWVRPSVFSSREDILQVLSHEAYELNALRGLFGKKGGKMGWGEFAQRINRGIPGNLHDKAWTFSDKIVSKSRHP